MRIKCESDCAELVKAINAKISLAGLYGILADIQELAESFECISFVWISRLRNVEADLLAKQVLSAELALLAATTQLDFKCVSKKKVITLFTLEF